MGKKASGCMFVRQSEEAHPFISEERCISFLSAHNEIKSGKLQEAMERPITRGRTYPPTIFGDAVFFRWSCIQ